MLTVSTSPDFAAKWLVHWLGHFAETNTGIDLRVSAAMHHVDFAREEVDLAVRHGNGNWPGLDTVRLSAEELFAVCSPKLLSGRRRLGKLSDILKFPLIHLDSRADWTNRLQAAGLDDAAVTHGPVMNRASMVIDAAINARGLRLRGRRSRPLISSTAGWCGPFRNRFAFQKPIGSCARGRPHRCQRLPRFAIGCLPKHRAT